MNPVPTIALLGANGQVGWELQRALQPLGRVLALGRSQAPLHDTAALLAALDAAAPQVIVNAAAHTAVDKAESEPELAAQINTHAPAALAQWAAVHKALLVHYSTDYVFDGSGTEPRAENAGTGPLSVYGATKLAGEQQIAASGCAHLIFRTSWVYAARGGNFAKTMLKLAMERDALNVVDDQVGAPTGADLIADVSAHALKAIFDELSPGCRRVLDFSSYQKDSVVKQGIYHLVAAGHTSWHAYAQRVIDAARAAGKPIRVAADAVQGIPSAQYKTPAQRPLNSRLNTQRLEQHFGLHLPPWQHGVDRLIAQLLAN